MTQRGSTYKTIQPSTIRKELAHLQTHILTIKLNYVQKDRQTELNNNDKIVDVMLKMNIHSDQPDNKTSSHSVKEIDQH